MVAPITGPYSRVTNANGPPTSLGYVPQWLSATRTWYRQRRPYNLPLAFTYQRRQVISYTNYLAPSGYTLYSSAPAIPSGSSATTCPEAYNKAYGNFVSKLKPDAAGLGINLAQRRQAMDMISHRCLRLASFASNLRKFRFAAAGRDLGLAPSQMKGLKLRRGSKQFANNYLEFHFGWSPLVGDIGSAVNILQNGVPPVKVSASSKERTSWTSKNESSDPRHYYLSEREGIWKIQTFVSVSNPNLFLANQLGFVNPAVVAWDAVPFSFVVDWFVNVSQFLNSFTDMWGLSLQNPFTTLLCIDRLQHRTTTFYGSPAKWTPYTVEYYQTTFMTRAPGSPPGPTLKKIGPWTISPTRAATSISLLLQKM